MRLFFEYNAKILIFFICLVLGGGDAYGEQPKARKTLIVIDPGHGGVDIGAKVKLIKEKNLALKTANLVRQILHKKGYSVILTRSKDVFTSLGKRVDIANDTKSHLFVSIHYNAFKNTSIEGIEVYYYNKGVKKRKSSSKKLADTVLGEMILKTKAKSRGVKAGNYHVIRETNMPAILIEGGFLTNPNEYIALLDKTYIEKIAESIASGIDKFLKNK